MNRAVIECENLIKYEVCKIRTILKTIHNCVPIRLEFKTIQVRLGCTDNKIVDVHNIDVENRWNSMFLTIDSCYKLKDVFETLCNMGEFKVKFQDSMTSLQRPTSVFKHNPDRKSQILILL